MSRDKYASFEDALIINHYPQQSERLDGGLSVDVLQSVGSFGVQLGRPESSPWVDINFHGDLEAPVSRDAVIEATVINPELAKHTGATAVINTIRLQAGDVYIIGRHKYPNLGKYTSSLHIRLSVLSEIYGVRVEVTDLDSTNGTGVRILGRGEEDSDVSSPLSRHSNEQEAAVNKDHLETFIEKYRREFQDLSDADFCVCMNVCESLRGKDQKVLRTQFNLWMHPDRNRTVNPLIAHSMYLLVMQELGL